MKKKLAQFKTLSKSEKNVPNTELTELNIKKAEFVFVIQENRLTHKASPIYFYHHI